MLTGGTLVAAGMMGTNIAIYGFNLVAARLLVTRDLGALTALFGILLVGTVMALGLQAVTARRLAVDPEDADEIISATLRVTVAVALGVGLVVALSSVGLSPALKLDGHWPVVLCGAALVPLTIMGAQCGVAQGLEQWGLLTALYLGNGVGRLVGGTVAMLITPTPTSAMVGIAIGSWLPVVVGAPILRGRWASMMAPGSRSLLREAFLSTHALLAYFVLSNMDSLIARNRLGEHDSGLYASGLILAKAALFFPQFVSVVLFPDLARSSDHRARLRAVMFVAGFGVLAVTATAALPRVALILAGGDKYSQITDQLWLFALAGSALAVVHLLVFDAIARHAHGIVVLVWMAALAVGGCAYGLDVGISGLVVTVASVATTLALVVYLAPIPAGSVTRFVPGAAHADGDVEGHREIGR
jgi:O-antigen/teichoic acid export membrane protein